MFGILTSKVHMAWMRVVSGRLKSDYRYSPAVYNNFVWPEPDDIQKQKIINTAQSILKARSNHKTVSFADMYGENMFLFTDLVKAHVANDKAVMDAYGFSQDMSEADIVAALMKMYQELVQKQSIS